MHFNPSLVVILRWRRGTAVLEHIAPARADSDSINAATAHQPPVNQALPTRRWRLSGAGWPTQRRSSGETIAPQTRLWLGDSMGELGAYYTLADLAFVGSSLVPLGGQNLIEACAYGCPVLMGRSTYNFSQAVEDAVQAQAARLIDSAEQGAALALQLLASPRELMQMRKAAEQFCHLHRGATARTLETLERERLG
jgi:3-deoxy-D-manno-octulosonic-acid transferase